MNPDNQLIVGVVMMSLGGFVALLAFTILREQQKAAKKKSSAKTDAEASKDVEAQETQPEEEESVDKEDKDIKAVFTASFQKVKNWILEREEEEEPDELQEKPVEEPEEAEEAVKETLPISNSINIFTLLRDEEKGNLIVQVGDHDYHSSQDLRDSPDWNRVEYAAIDLSAWLMDAEDQGAKTKSRDLLEDKPRSMVEQINHFLQQNLAEIKSEKRRIKLYEGPDETVQVLIDKNSYAIDEVPDPKVSKLIKEAVSKWEALQ